MESFKDFNLKELMANFKAEDIHIYQARNMEVCKGLRVYEE